MSGSALLAYAAALMLAIATPGPAMIAVVGKGVADGVRPALAMTTGIAVGDVMLGSLAMIGLAAVLSAFGWAFTVIKFGAAAYLVWLGIGMWRSLPLLADGAAGKRRDFGAGWAVALSNPKAILFHASLMPLIIDLRQLSLAGALAILGIIFTMTIAVLGGYALLAGRGGRWLRTPARLAGLSKAAGAAMVGAAIAIALR